MKTKTKICKWCYEVYLIENKSKHFKCIKKKREYLESRKRSIEYDKTEGQKNDKTITRI
jgi:hypothetical protein